MHDHTRTLDGDKHGGLRTARGYPERARAWLLKVALSLAAVAWIPLLLPTDTSAAEIEDADLEACVESATPQQSLMQTVGLAVIGSNGDKRTSTVEVSWKQFAAGASKTLLKVTESAVNRGVMILISEHRARAPDVHMYLPELGRDRRITSSALQGSMLGSDFSFEDYRLLKQPLRSSGSIHRLADGSWNGRSTYVVEAQPDRARSAYSRVVTSIDKSFCLPVHIDLFAPNGALRKTIEVEEKAVTRQSGKWVPGLTVMTDHANGSTSTMSSFNVRIDPELSRYLFSVAALRKGS